ncbi:IS1595 family transposase, partial [Bacillus pacificus]|nr:IS1595 family transposase [Bacillus pacificus]
MLPSENKDNTLQIKEKSTERTTPFFVLEVTARSAADILDIHP